MSKVQVVRVVRVDERSRYELLADGVVAGFADFVPQGSGAVRLTHTEIDPGHGGKGYGSILAAGVLDDLRARGLQPVPECDFIAAYIRKKAAAGPG